MATAAERARRPVPAASVAAFRIGFGLLVSFAALRFLANGWVGTLYLAPDHHLTYRWFGWVAPLPSPWLHLVVATVGAAGVCIALGWRHRLATAVFLVAFGYLELLDAALYLNHYWFVTLTAICLAVLPVTGRWSLDARAGRVDASSWVPAATLWVLRGQLALVYVFAGVAKLNPDWLLRAQPLRLWLADRADVALVGPLLAEPATAFVAAWAAALFDCTIVGWLLWHRSRPFAYATLVVFHLVTGALFRIGVFPVVMIVATLVFFDPDWPERALERIAGTRRRLPVTPPPSPSVAPAPSLGRARSAFLLAFAAVQVALPVRHYGIDGNVRWTEEGYYLSWRVMLTEKAGHVEFRITDPGSGRSWLAEADEVLVDWQIAHAATRPDLIHATALLLADEHDPTGALDLEVRADAWVSMNGRAAARLIDPDVDLAAHERGELPDGWILTG